MPDATIRYCSKCNTFIAYRDGLCQRCIAFGEWNHNPDIDHLGVFKFFQKVIPLAFKSFKYGVPYFHREIIWEVIRNEPKWRFFDRQIVIAAPRGSSKTTLLTKGLVLFLALFGLKRYIVIASKTSRTAEKSLRWIRQMLGKAIIIQLFGDLRPEAKGKRLETDEIEGRWTSSLIILKNGVTIEAIGMGQQLRSAAEGEDVNRIDLFIADDTETDENTRTPERRENNEVWLFETVLPSLDVDTGTIVYINTQTHSQSILTKLLESEGWRKKFYQISYFNEDGKEFSLWPEKFPMSVIDGIRKNYELAGRRNSFYKEYYNLIRSERGFSDKWIRRFRGECFEMHGRKWVKVLREGEPDYAIYPATMTLGIDSSFSFSESADFTVMMPQARIPGGDRFQFPISRGRFTTYDDVENEVVVRKGIISEAVRLHEIYHFDIVCIDSSAQQVGLYRLLKHEFESKGFRCRVMEFNASKEKKPKMDRLVNYLQPLYESGRMYHLPSSIEHDKELLSIGDTTDDILDAEFNADIFSFDPENVQFNPIGLSREREEVMVNRQRESVKRDWMVL